MDILQGSGSHRVITLPLFVLLTHWHHSPVMLRFVQVADPSLGGVHYHWSVLLTSLRKVQ